MRRTFRMALLAVIAVAGYAAVSAPPAPAAETTAQEYCIGDAQGNWFCDGGFNATCKFDSDCKF